MRTACLRNSLLIALALSAPAGGLCGDAPPVTLAREGVRIVVSGPDEGSLRKAAVDAVRSWLTLWNGVVDPGARKAVLGSEELSVRVVAAASGIELHVSWTAPGFLTVRCTRRIGHPARASEELQRLLWQVLPWPARWQAEADAELEGGNVPGLGLVGLRDRKQDWCGLLVDCPRTVIPLNRAAGAPRAWLLVGWEGDGGRCLPVRFWNDQSVGMPRAGEALVVLPQGSVVVTLAARGRRKRPLPAAGITLLYGSIAGGEVSLSPAQRLSADGIGQAQLSVRLDRVPVVEVRYAGIAQRQPLGIRADTGDVVLPVARSHVLAYARCRELLREATAYRQWQLDLLRRLKEATDRKDLEAVQRLLDVAGRAAPPVTTWRGELADIRQQAQLSAPTGWKLLERTAKAIDAAATPMNLEPFHRWLAVVKKQQEVERLRNQLSRQLDAFDWLGAHRTLQQLARLVPDDPRIRKRLARLERLLKPHDDEHATARAWLQQLMAQADYETLADQADLIELQLEVLIRVRDVLTLLQFQRAAERWTEAIATRRRQLAGARSADEEQRTELARLVELADRLSKMLQRAAAVTRGFRL